jgi:hypothetical protein
MRHSSWSPVVAPFVVAIAVVIGHLARAAEPTAVGAGAVVARLWSYDNASSTLIESRYVVDLASKTRAQEEHPPTEYRGLRGERKRLDIAAYDQLAVQFRARVEIGASSDLSDAMSALEKSRAAGYTPGDQALVSPNGAYAVLAPVFSRPLLVNLQTLETQRLLEKSDPNHIPMAWSPDSRLLAFALSEANGQIVVYDVERHLVRSTIRANGAEVSALLWSSDLQQLVALELVNRRLHKTPLGLLIAFSGHPDYRNDLVLRLYGIAGHEQGSVALKSNLTEQSSYDYWIEWK